MTKLLRYSLLFLASLLLSSAWFPSFTGLFLFVAFIPLFWVENYYYNNKSGFINVFLSAYLSFFLWNILSFWWVSYVSFVAFFVGVLFNALLPAFVFGLFHITKCRFNVRTGYAAFIFYWLGYEYLHSQWDAAVPWLFLGQGLAQDLKLIQWYEFTGSSGGSLLILLVNVFIYRIGSEWKISTTKIKVAGLLLFLALLIVPAILSISMFNHYLLKNTEQDKIQVVVLQPNIDPYNVKFDPKTANKQLDGLLDLADSIADETVDYFIAPETALPQGFWIDKFNTEVRIKKIRHFLSKYPQAKFIVGINSYRKAANHERKKVTVRKSPNGKFYFEAYNSAIQIDTSTQIAIYHKSQLMMGPEKMPFLETFSFLEHFILDLGGLVGSLGKQDKRTVFSNNSTKAGIIICWESVFSQYVTEYVKNGANVLFVITNDGWWGDTPGYKNHLLYSRLRSVETRRSIARSANTGISCIINQRGEIMQATSYQTKTAIKASININNKQTYFVKNGDYIGRIAAFFAVLTVLYTFVFKLIPKKTNK